MSVGGMKIWAAAVAAVAVQPFVLALRLLPGYLDSSRSLYGVELVLFGVIAVASAMTLILGIPTFLILRRLRRDGWLSLAVSGFLVAATPALLSWPRHMTGYSAGHNWHGRYVNTYVDGSPTMFAWLGYLESAAFFGLHGCIGAVVFYAVWRRLSDVDAVPKPETVVGGDGRDAD